MENAQIFEMADRLKAAKELKKDLDAQVKAVNAEIEQLDRDLSDAMAEQELDKFTRNGSTFYLNSRLFASPAGKFLQGTACRPRRRTPGMARPCGLHI